MFAPTTAHEVGKKRQFYFNLTGEETMNRKSEMMCRGTPYIKNYSVLALAITVLGFCFIIIVLCMYFPQQSMAYLKADKFLLTVFSTHSTVGDTSCVNDKGGIPTRDIV